MATYVMGDIHGEYDLFLELLDKIGLRGEDTLYVTGDVVDRGPHPMKVVLKLMEMPNAFCLLGNHELMALECLPFLDQEITDESLAAFDPVMQNNLLSWLKNGAAPTIREYRALPPDMREAVLDYLRDCLIYTELSAGGRRYLLVHAGLGHYSPEKQIEDYSVQELVWEPADYETQYFPDHFTVTGHMPTQTIAGNPRPGFICRRNNHIAVDCGACFPGGRLAALCLETGEEFYASRPDGSVL